MAVTPRMPHSKRAYISISRLISPSTWLLHTCAVTEIYRDASEARRSRKLAQRALLDERVLQNVPFRTRRNELLLVKLRKSKEWDAELSYSTDYISHLSPVRKILNVISNLLIFVNINLKTVVYGVDE